eukprot:gene15689-17271_t
MESLINVSDGTSIFNSILTLFGLVSRERAFHLWTIMFTYLGLAAAWLFYRNHGEKDEGEDRKDQADTEVSPRGTSLNIDQTTEKSNSDSSSTEDGETSDVYCEINSEIEIVNERVLRNLAAREDEMVQDFGDENISTHSTCYDDEELVREIKEISVEEPGSFDLFSKDEELALCTNVNKENADLVIDVGRGTKTDKNKHFEGDNSEGLEKTIPTLSVTVQESIGGTREGGCCRSEISDCDGVAGRNDEEISNEQESSKVHGDNEQVDGVYSISVDFSEKEGVGEGDPEEEDMEEGDVQEGVAEEEDVQEEDEQEEDAQEEDAQEDVDEEDAQEEDAQEEDAQEEDAQEEDAQEEDAQEEDGSRADEENFMNLFTNANGSDDLKREKMIEEFLNDYYRNSVGKTEDLLEEDDEDEAVEVIYLEELEVEFSEKIQDGNCSMKDGPDDQVEPEVSGQSHDDVKRTECEIENPLQQAIFEYYDGNSLNNLNYDEDELENCFEYPQINNLDKHKPEIEFDTDSLKTLPVDANFKPPKCIEKQTEFEDNSDDGLERIESHSTEYQVHYLTDNPVDLGVTEKFKASAIEALVDFQYSEPAEITDSTDAFHSLDSVSGEKKRVARFAGDFESASGPDADDFAGIEKSEKKECFEVVPAVEGSFRSSGEQRRSALFHDAFTYLEKFLGFYLKQRPQKIALVNYKDVNFTARINRREIQLCLNDVTDILISFGLLQELLPSVLGGLLCDNSLSLYWPARRIAHDDQDKQFTREKNNAISCLHQSPAVCSLKTKFHSPCTCSGIFNVFEKREDSNSAIAKENRDVLESYLNSGGFADLSFIPTTHAQGEVNEPRPENDSLIDKEISWRNLNCVENDIITLHSSSPTLESNTKIVSDDNYNCEETREVCCENLPPKDRTFTYDYLFSTLTAALVDSESFSEASSSNLETADDVDTDTVPDSFVESTFLSPVDEDSHTACESEVFNTRLKLSSSETPEDSLLVAKEFDLDTAVSERSRTDVTDEFIVPFEGDFEFTENEYFVKSFEYQSDSEVSGFSESTSNSYDDDDDRLLECFDDLIKDSDPNANDYDDNDDLSYIDDIKRITTALRPETESEFEFEFESESNSIDSEQSVDSDMGQGNSLGHKGTLAMPVSEDELRGLYVKSHGEYAIINKRQIRFSPLVSEISVDRRLRITLEIPSYQPKPRRRIGHESDVFTKSLEILNSNGKATVNGSPLLRREKLVKRRVTKDFSPDQKVDRSRPQECPTISSEKQKGGDLPVRNTALKTESPVVVDVERKAELRDKLNGDASKLWCPEKKSTGCPTSVVTDDENDNLRQQHAYSNNADLIDVNKKFHSKDDNKGDLDCRSATDAANEEGVLLHEPKITAEPFEKNHAEETARLESPADERNVDLRSPDQVEIRAVKAVEVDSAAFKDTTISNAVVNKLPQIIIDCDEQSRAVESEQRNVDVNEKEIVETDKSKARLQCDALRSKSLSSLPSVRRRERFEPPMAWFYRNRSSSGHFDDSTATGDVSSKYGGLRKTKSEPKITRRKPRIIISANFEQKKPLKETNLDELMKSLDDLKSSKTDVSSSEMPCENVHEVAVNFQTVKQDSSQRDTGLNAVPKPDLTAERKSKSTTVLNRSRSNKNKSVSKLVEKFQNSPTKTMGAAKSVEDVIGNKNSVMQRAKSCNLESTRVKNVKNFNLEKNTVVDQGISNDIKSGMTTRAAEKNRYPNGIMEGEDKSALKSLCFDENGKNSAAMSLKPDIISRTKQSSEADNDEKLGESEPNLSLCVGQSVDETLQSCGMVEENNNIDRIEKPLKMQNDKPLPPQIELLSQTTDAASEEIKRTSIYGLSVFLSEVPNAATIDSEAVDLSPTKRAENYWLQNGGPSESGQEKHNKDQVIMDIDAVLDGAEYVESVDGISEHGDIDNAEDNAVGNGINASGNTRARSSFRREKRLRKWLEDKQNLMSIDNDSGGYERSLTDQSKALKRIAIAEGINVKGMKDKKIENALLNKLESEHKMTDFFTQLRYLINLEDEGNDKEGENPTRDSEPMAILREYESHVMLRKGMSPFTSEDEGNASDAFTDITDASFSDYTRSRTSLNSLSLSQGSLIKTPCISEDRVSESSYVLTGKPLVEEIVVAERANQVEATPDSFFPNDAITDLMTQAASAVKNRRRSKRGARQTPLANDQPKQVHVLPQTTTTTKYTDSHVLGNDNEQGMISYHNNLVPQSDELDGKRKRVDYALYEDAPCSLSSERIQEKHYHNLRSKLVNNQQPKPTASLTSPTQRYFPQRSNSQKYLPTHRSTPNVDSSNNSLSSSMFGSIDSGFLPSPEIKELRGSPPQRRMRAVDHASLSSTPQPQQVYRRDALFRKSTDRAKHEHRSMPNLHARHNHSESEKAAALALDQRAKFPSINTISSQPRRISPSTRLSAYSANQSPLRSPVHSPLRSPYMSELEEDHNDYFDYDTSTSEITGFFSDSSIDVGGGAFEGFDADDEDVFYPRSPRRKHNEQNFSSDFDDFMAQHSDASSEEFFVPLNTNSRAHGREISCAFPPCRRRDHVDRSQRTSFTSCIACFTYYCSKECRKAHWKEHKRTCYYGRVNYYTKALIRRFETSSIVNEQLSEIAVRGYEDFGRGCVLVTFSSPMAAKFFLVSGTNSFATKPVFSPLKDVDYGRITTKHQVLLLQTLHDYIPESELVIDLTVYLGKQNEVRMTSQSRLKSTALLRCTKLPLNARFLNENSGDPSQQNESSYDIKVFYLPRSQRHHFVNDTEARRYYCREVSYGLRRYGVQLKTDYRDVYDKLCLYVEDNTEFAPITLYGQANGKNYKCIIFPEGFNAHSSSMELQGRAGPKRGLAVARKTTKMADRITRSAGRAVAYAKDSPVNNVAQPFRVSKRKLKKNLTDKEKEEIKKHEISGTQFRYRLRSVKAILNQLHSNEDASPKSEGKKRNKQRRRSSMKRAGRKSILQSTLIQNAKLADEKEKAPSTQPTEETSTRNTENVPEEKSIAEAVTMQETSIAQASTSENSENKERTALETNIVEDNVHTLPVSMEVSMNNNKETEEEQKEALEKRQIMLDTLKQLQNEQIEWANLLKKHQSELSQQELSSNCMTDGEEFLSNDQRKFLESGINVDEFVDKLQNQADDFYGAADYIAHFVAKLDSLKENAIRHLKLQTEKLAKQEFESDCSLETPRRLITKITKLGAD